MINKQNGLATTMNQTVRSRTNVGVVANVYDQGVINLNNRLRDSQERTKDHKRTLLYNQLD